LEDTVSYHAYDGELIQSANGESPQEETITTMQVGLRLPDGRIVWPPDEYKGYPLNTADERAILLQVLNKTADDLSFAHADFLNYYSWCKRILTTKVVAREIGSLPIDSPEAFADGEKDEGRDDESHYNSTVHARSLGGPAQGDA
jgi:hypothetical protein